MVLKYIHITVLGSLLFFVTSSVYGYITGASILVPGGGARLPMHNAVVVALVIVSVYGIVIFTLQKLDSRNFSLGDWLLPTLFGLIPFMFTEINDDVGEIFRFYLAPTSLFIMVIFAICSKLFLENRTTSLAIGQGVFFLLMILIFVVGIFVYAIKGGIVLIGNSNFAMQFLLSMLCIVMPIFYGLMAARLKFLSRS